MLCTRSIIGYKQAISLQFVQYIHVGPSFYNTPLSSNMTRFLQLLIFLHALLTTIIASPTAVDNWPNSWLPESLPNNAGETLLAGTFTGGSIDPLISPDSPTTSSPEQNPTPNLSWPILKIPRLLPPTTPEVDWARPMFLCCTGPWNNDSEEQKTCVISLYHILNWPLWAKFLLIPHPIQQKGDGILITVMAKQSIAREEFR